MFCTTCGAENAAESQFCTRCGARLPDSGSAGYSTVSADTTSVLGAVGVVNDEDGAGDGELTGLGTDQGEVDALAPGTALLVVRRGPNAGSRFLLDADLTTSGRHPDSDIFLDDVTVSRRHAEFRRQGLRFVVYDVGSLNGTYVNGERIEQTTLAGGDEVQIGKFRLVLLAAPAAEDAS